MGGNTVKALQGLGFTEEIVKVATNSGRPPTNLSHGRTENGQYSIFDAIQFIAQKQNQRMVWKRLCKTHTQVVTNVTTCVWVPFDRLINHEIEIEIEVG